MWTDEHYGQIPKYQVSGLTLKMSAWEFSYGAEDRRNPNFVAVSLSPIDIAFQQSSFAKRAALYVVPSEASADHYYLTEWSSDPALNEMENPPTARWNEETACIPCLSLTVPALGAGSALIVEPNIIELPQIHDDPRRDVVSKAGQIRAWRKGKQPEGWELLDAQKHKKAFPISLGRLESGEGWYILTPEAALDKTES